MEITTHSRLAQRIVDQASEEQSRLAMIDILIQITRGTRPLFGPLCDLRRE